MIPKNIWIKNIVKSLKQIASAEFQEKGWVKNEIHDYCTFVETSCGFFMEGDVEGFLEHAKEFGFSEIQIKKIDLVRKAFDEYTDEHGWYDDPAIIVKDPEWLKIRELAKDALKSLGIEKYLDPSKSIFKESLLRRIYWVSDRDIQDRWCLQESGPKQTFEALMNDIFKISKIAEIIAHYKDYEIRDNQIQVLRRFHDALKVYREKTQDFQNLRKIVDDPEWHHIQALAQEVVKVFEYEP